MRTYKLPLNLLLVVGLLLAGLGSSVWVEKTEAQQDGKSTPAPDVQSNRVYDRYPHPQTRGALRFSLADQWDKTDLTYQFNNCPSLVSCEDAWNVSREAFAHWEAVSVLTFREVTSRADIEIQWVGEEAGMDDTIYGFAYFPSDGGDIYINDAVEWEIGTGGDADLYLTMAHEIGHTLGLDHSDDPAALMYPTPTSETTGIVEDDIEGIQALYGTPDGNPPTLNNTTLPGMVAVEDTNTEDDSAAVDGTIDDDIPYELWEIEVEAGETLLITMSVVDGNLEPHLGILTDDEEIVLAESDNDNQREASLTFTFDEAGIYVIVTARDGIENGSSRGSYRLNIETADPSDAQNDGGGISAGMVELVNFTGIALCELYVSSSTSEDWGEEWLAGEPLEDGEAIADDLEAGDYDVLAITCEGGEISEYYLSVSENSSIEIYDDTIAVYR